MSTASIHDDELPASYRPSGRRSIALPSQDLESFLASDLSVDRIERVQQHLWMVGRPQPPRPLNLQVGVLNRAIVATTDASLHLIWTPGRIFVKPLPAFFFSELFYEQYLHGKSTLGPALGLLFSYIALLPNPVDFEMAQEAHLMPCSRDWKEWKALSRRVLEEYPAKEIYEHIPRRYLYGELRLGRLDVIYRCLCGDWLHGYSSLTGKATYGQFFSDNVGIIASVTVYIALVLTAMQVGLAIPTLQVDVAFRRACYGFAVFSIISPIAAIGLLVMLFLVLFSANWWRTTLAHETLHRNKTHGQGTEVELGATSSKQSGGYGT